MSHFARVVNGQVEEVIVAEQDFVDSLPVEENTQWIQTSYNTYAGQHQLGGTPLRKNYAGVGYTYDTERDAFIPPKPYIQWILNESTCQWEPPHPAPNDGKVYAWSEYKADWEERAYYQ
jgi:hypothetical protein